jgi:hypothetical protein
MSDLSLPRRAQNRETRTDFVEASASGLLRRHVIKLEHIAEQRRLHCRCAEITGTTAHLHSCSYAAVLRTIDTNEQRRKPGAPETPQPT